MNWKQFLKPDIPRLILTILIIYLFFLFYGKLMLFDFSGIYALLVTPIMLLMLVPFSLFALSPYSLYLLLILLVPYLVSCGILYFLREKDKKLKWRLIGYIFLFFCFLIIISFVNGKRFEKCFEISGCKQCWINTSREFHPVACFLGSPCRRDADMEETNARLYTLSCLCNKAQAEEFKNPTLNSNIENFLQDSVNASIYFKVNISPQLGQNPDATSICKIDFTRYILKIEFTGYKALYR